MCKDARIVLGAVASAPLELKEISAWIEGVQISEKLINMVAYKISERVHPLPNVAASVSYRKKMVEVLVRRGLRELVLPSSS
jgi:CO/xanthine dehydrogenase FAD-binding subunit